MIYYLSYFFILFSLNFISSNLIPDEYYILEEFYNTTNGEKWAFKSDTSKYGIKWNFNGSSDPCNDNWQGIKCTYQDRNIDNYVRNISLLGYKLNGPLVGSIGNLKNLSFLHLGNNSLHGKLPKNLANSKTLYYIRFHDNKFSGQIPAEYGNFTSLINMFFDRNELTGTIPPEIANLPKATWIDFGFNKITGTIPKSIGFMKSLNNFQVNFNYLTGTIPKELGNLSANHMRELQLDFNYLTGTIPSELGNLTDLDHLYLGPNELHGGIPDSFSNLKKLKLLSVHHNHLSGPYPTAVGEMESLQYLITESNYFTGPLPDSIGSLAYLKIFDTHKNLVSGIIPSSFAKLENLHELQVSHNSIFGSIPENLEMLEMKYFIVYGNYLTGTIPTSLVTLPKLQEIYIYKNILDGSIPIEIATLTNLTSLLAHDNRLTGYLEDCFNPAIQTKLKNVQLSSNHFKGNIPKSLFKIKSIQNIDLTGNCFKGSLPNTMCESTNLVSLYAEGLQSAEHCERHELSDSYFVKNPMLSTIPECIFSLNYLQDLYLSGNSLTGSLSDSLELGASLSSLSLAYNQLSGNIPKAIQKRKWIKLDLSYNRFYGTLKSNFATELLSTSGDPTSDTVLNLQNNRLSGEIPSSFDENTQGIHNLKVLRNNLFTCENKEDDLPGDDPEYDQYQCGSNASNAVYYTWVVGAFLFVIGIVLIAYKYISTQSHVFLKQFDEVTSIETSKSYDFSKFVNGLESITKFSTIYIMIILLVLYVILRHFYTTHRYVYGWSVSAAYLSSGTAAGLILTFLIIFMIVFVFLTSYYVQKVSINLKLYNNPKVLLIQIILCLIGLGVSIGMNILFLYLVIFKIGSITSLLQFLLALYFILWNDYLYPKIIHFFISYMKPSSLDDASNSRLVWNCGILQISMQIIQYIIVPCILVSVMSDNCFYNVFQSRNDVTTDYLIKTCGKLIEYYYFQLSKDGFCIYVDTAFDNSYVPAFDYSYQCSSSFLVYYVPVFVYMCILVTFIIPVVQYLIYKFLPLGTYLLPNVLSRKDMIVLDQKDLKLKNYEYFFQSNQLIISILGYMMILLTFGAMYPPLAIAIALMIVSVIIGFKLKTGRFLYDAIELKAIFYVDIFNEECVGVLQYYLFDKMIVGMYISTCFLFYLLFIFDTDGNQVGIDGAYWILIVMPLLIFIFIIYVLIIESYLIPNKPKQSIQESSINSSLNNTDHTMKEVNNNNPTIPEIYQDYEMSSVVKSPLTN